MSNNTIRAILINICLIAGALAETPERKAIALYFAIVAALMAADYVKEKLRDEEE